MLRATPSARSRAASALARHPALAKPTRPRLVPQAHVSANSVTCYQRPTLLAGSCESAGATAARARSGRPSLIRSASCGDSCFVRGQASVWARSIHAPARRPQRVSGHLTSWRSLSLEKDSRRFRNRVSESGGSSRLTTGLSGVCSTCRPAVPPGAVRVFRRLACAQTRPGPRTAEPCAPHARPRPCPHPQVAAGAVGAASQEVVLRPPTLAVLGPRRSPSAGYGARYSARPADGNTHPLRCRSDTPHTARAVGSAVRGTRCSLQTIWGSSGGCETLMVDAPR